MEKQLPISIQAFVTDFTRQVQLIIYEDVLAGIYLYGSIALGCFHEKKSDIDFVVLLKRSLTNEEVAKLKQLHQKCNKGEFGKRLDGMYLQLNDCGKSNDKMEEYLYCAEGKVQIGYYDVNRVTWWILKHHGITLFGPSSSTLPINITWEHIIENMDYNMNRYWYSKANNKMSLLFDGMIESATLTVSRIICSLEDKVIVGKEEGIKKLLLTFPEKWHLLLKEGLRIRNRPNADSLYSNKISRANDCKQFILYAQQYCNEKYFT